MEKQKALLDALADAVILSAGGRIAWANLGASQLLSVSRDDLIGTRLGDWLAEGEIERLLTVELQRDDGWRLPQSFRLRFLRHPDRAEVPADVRFGRQDGQLILAARDATESRTAEQLMSELANLSVQAGGMLGVDALLEGASPLFEALGWVASLTDIFGQTAKVSRLVGQRADNAVAKYGESLLGKVVPLDRYPVIAAVIARGEALYLDNAPSTQLGSVHDAVALSESMERARGLSRTAWVPVPTPGGMQVLTVAGTALSEHDFVALQLFGAQLAAAHRLEMLRAELVQRERLAAVGEMAAVLAHEVRNPLGVIFNAVGQLRRQASSPQAGQVLDILSEEAERLQRLVTDLLELARPPVPHFEPVEVAEVVRHAIDAGKQDPGCRGGLFRIEAELPGDLPPVWVDPMLLRRALVNVLVNAIQHVPKNGLVRVAIDHSTPSELCIRVMNEGQPISDEVASRIFEPFFTTRAAGTGLGLAAVKQILGLLDGRVEVEPRADGACFALWLKVAAR